MHSKSEKKKHTMTYCLRYVCALAKTQLLSVQFHL